MNPLAERYKTAPPGIREFVGIDGCPGGWIAIHLAPRSPASAEFIPAGQMAQWLRNDGPPRLVLIDIPIGLPDAAWARLRGGDGSRGCEREARRLLGPRRSSVFNPPARPALAASRDDASQVNFRELGKKLSRQSLGILPKIREVDEALADPGVAGSAATLWEAHPELAFRACNAGRPLGHWKRTPDGQRERLALLERVHAGARAFVKQAAAQYPRKRVGTDDLVDALVLAVAALRGYPDHYRALPSIPEQDSAGRPMEMVFWQVGT
jgi:predicted RNase H-like nuclease